ncbi:MAG: DUF6130 family protein [Roseiflexaceae bacterium]
MRRLMFLTTLLLLMVGSLTPASAAGPELAIVSPASGAIIQGTTVTVDFKASGLAILASTVPLAEYGKRPDANKPDQGHLHITLDLWPLVVWEKPDAYTFTNVPPGEHQVKIELVNNDHSAREPAVTQMVRFRTEAAAPMPATMPRTGAPETSAGVVLSVLALIAFCLIGSGIVLRKTGKRQS